METCYYIANTILVGEGRRMSLEELEEYIRSFGLFLAALIRQWIPALSFVILTVLAILVQVFQWGDDKVPPAVIWTLAALSFLAAAFGVFHNLRRDYEKLQKEKREQLWLPLRTQLIEERKAYLSRIPLAYGWRKRENEGEHHMRQSDESGVW